MYKAKKVTQFVELRGCVLIAPLSLDDSYFLRTESRVGNSNGSFPQSVAISKSKMFDCRFVCLPFKACYVIEVWRHTQELDPTSTMNYATQSPQESHGRKAHLVKCSRDAARSLFWEGNKPFDRRKVSFLG